MEHSTRDIRASAVACIAILASPAYSLSEDPLGRQKILISEYGCIKILKEIIDNPENTMKVSAYAKQALQHLGGFVHDQI